MSKVSWPPKDFKLPPDETKTQVFNKLLDDYGKLMPKSGFMGHLAASNKLTNWRTRYRNARPD